MFRRRLFDFVAIVSLLLCLATVALWVRSYWRYDNLEWASEYRTRFVASEGGRVLVQVNHGSHGKTRFMPVEYCCSVIDARHPDTMGRPWRFGGFWIENLTFYPQGSAPIPYTDVVVPLWAAMALFLVLPGMRLYRCGKSRRARWVGLCPHCGYDLRATPDLCPECGTVPPAK
jgi:hypothetical protein